MTDAVDARILEFFQTRPEWCRRALLKDLEEYSSRTTALREAATDLHDRMTAAVVLGDQPGEGWEFVGSRNGWIPPDLVREWEAFPETPPIDLDPDADALSLEGKTYHLAQRLDSVVHRSASPFRSITDKLAGHAAHRLILARHKPRTLPDDLTATAWLNELEAALPAEATTPAEAPAAADNDPKPVVQSQSGRVKLFGEQEMPVVDGKRVNRLTPAQYRAVKVLLEAGDDGLTKDALIAKCEGDPLKVLKNLRDKDASGWKDVISFPGVTGGGYRIL